MINYWIKKKYVIPRYDKISSMFLEPFEKSCLRSVMAVVGLRLLHLQFAYGVPPWFLIISVTQS